MDMAGDWEEAFQAPLSVHGGKIVALRERQLSESTRHKALHLYPEESRDCRWAIHLGELRGGVRVCCDPCKAKMCQPAFCLWQNSSKLCVESFFFLFFIFLFLVLQDGNSQTMSHLWWFGVSDLLQTVTLQQELFADCGHTSAWGGLWPGASAIQLP